MSKTVLHQILGRSGLAPVTKRSYARIIDRWVEFAGEDPSSWTPMRAQEFYDQLIEGGLAIQSANVYMDSLCYVSQWHAKRGGVHFADVQRQRGTKGHRRQREGEPILSEDEARLLLMTCEHGSIVDLRDLAMLVALLETGMRRKSIQGMRLDGFKRGSNPTVTIPIKGPGGEETFDCPLSDTALAALDAWTAELRVRDVTEGAVFRRLVPRGRKGESFDIGDELSLTGINEIVEGRAKVAKLRHVNPHMFRHTFLSWRTYIAKLSPLEISQLTGHRVSAVIEGGVRMSLGAMPTYMHRPIEEIRNSTPSWLSSLVKELLS